MNFRYELNYPVHKERQKIYIYNSLLVVFLPILVLLFLAKILAWILNGFSKS